MKFILKWGLAQRLPNHALNAGFQDSIVSAGWNLLATEPSPTRIWMPDWYTPQNWNYFGKLKNGKGRTKALYDIFCPKCGLLGQLKADFRRASTQYSVDHYTSHRSRGGYHGKYKSNCYLGNKFQVGVI